MPKVQIQSTDIEYADSDVVTFEEGLVGLPHLRRLVVVSQPEILPFLWLASVEEAETAFLVLEPRVHCSGYQPIVPAEVKLRIGLRSDEEPLLLSIARIMPEWTDSTVNLRAPLIIAPGSMRGTQLVLSDSQYQLNESFTQWAEAA